MMVPLAHKGPRVQRVLKVPEDLSGLRVPLVPMVLMVLMVILEMLDKMEIL